MDTSDAGRLGGIRRRDLLTPEKRKRIAKKAIRARWKKFFLEHPDKIKPKANKAK